MLYEKLSLWPGRDDVTLTAFVTPPDPGWPFPAYPRPAMVICPGGAYLDLSAAEGAPIATYFSTQGYQAFVLEYTVATRAPAGQEIRYPVQLVDLARAISLIRQNSGRWNLDPDKVAIAGFSAGGHLCASYAVHWHEPWLAQRLGVESELLRPSAAVLGYPITDYELQDSAFPNPIPMMVESNRALFGTAHPSPQQKAELSPCLHVNEHTPPVFLVHAADDGLVPVGNSFSMAQALSRACIPFELHIFQQGDHGFANAQPMDRPWETHRSRACAAWLPLVCTWLLKQFAPETMEAALPSAEEFFQQKHHGGKQ